jgi:hypothetical protein
MRAAPHISENLTARPVIDPVLPSVPFDTTEVRWFAHGPMPRELVDWFTSSGRSGTLEVRRDSYLAGDSPAVGRKRRNLGPFEIKTRLAIGNAVSISGRLAGLTEDWRKVVAPAPGRAGTWTEVHKVVLTRTYHASDGDRVTEVAANDTSLPGCDIEIAAITVGGVEAWTFALEAWGRTSVRHRLLETSAEAFVAAVGLPDLVTNRLTQEMAYPRWLAATVWDHSYER